MARELTFEDVSAARQPRILSGDEVSGAEPVATPADVLAALSATIDQMAAGAITRDEAAVVAGVLDSQRRAADLADIEARLARLEQEKGTKP